MAKLARDLMGPKEEIAELLREVSQDTGRASL
jgi:hypothetical protein